jgi:hypothetical protein
MLHADLQMDTKVRGSQWAQIYNFLFRKHHKGNFYFESKKIKEKYWQVSHELI